MMNEKDSKAIHDLFYEFHSFENLGLLKSKLVNYVTTVRKEAREAAFREAARDICVHCDQRATSHAAEVEGPNSAGNYIHKSKSVKAHALCAATSIHARLSREQSLILEW